MPRHVVGTVLLFSVGTEIHIKEFNLW